MYLTFETAVTLILKHATLLWFSHSNELAITTAELNYKKANIDEAIQQHLMAHAPEHTVEQFASFIMGLDIGSFIFPFVTSIAYHF